MIVIVYDHLIDCLNNASDDLKIPMFETPESFESSIDGCDTDYDKDSDYIVIDSYICNMSTFSKDWIHLNEMAVVSLIVPFDKGLNYAMSQVSDFLAFMKMFNTNFSMTVTDINNNKYYRYVITLSNL